MTATPPDWFWRMKMLEGEDYTALLARLHRHLRPRRYLEIGTRDGTSLRLADCASVAIDPNFQLRLEVVGSKPRCLFFQEPSDRFFADHDPKALLGGPIDLAFLDGMHLYEFLLRDFINTERHCRANSVIVLHDCMPTDVYLARRDEQDRSLAVHSEAPADWWAGDVWKTVAILQRWRPDLRIAAYTAPPTGIVTVTNLDPGSDVLSRHYAEAIEALRVTGPADHEAYMARLAPLAPSFFERFEDVASRYWL